MQPARAQRIASQPLRSASARASHPVHRSALHRKQSAHRAAQRSALHRNQLATHRPAHRILYSAAHRANATSPRIANNPRTDNQPSSDFGVSTGLISQGYWEQSKWYFVNVERGNIADKLQPRNINVSFSNNSNVPIDVIIFTFYSDQLTIDVETGIVTK
jgi:hypothetical protein